MKKMLVLIISVTSMMLNAQEAKQLMSNAEKFSKSSGKIIQSEIIYDKSYKGILGELDRVSLIKFSEYMQNDSIYGLRFYGSTTSSWSKDIVISKNYSVIVDYDDLENILSWIELVKNNSAYNTSDKNQISYSSIKSNLVLKYYGDTFEIQYDKFDYNSISKLANKRINDLYEKLKEIEKLWPKHYQTK